MLFDRVHRHPDREPSLRLPFAISDKWAGCWKGGLRMRSPRCVWPYLPESEGGVFLPADMRKEERKRWEGVVYFPSL